MDGLHCLSCLGAAFCSALCLVQSLYSRHEKQRFMERWQSCGEAYTQRGQGNARFPMPRICGAASRGSCACVCVCARARRWSHAHCFLFDCSVNLTRSIPRPVPLYAGAGSGRIASVVCVCVCVFLCVHTCVSVLLGVLREAACSAKRASSSCIPDVNFICIPPPVSSDRVLIWRFA